LKATEGPDLAAIPIADSAVLASSGLPATMRLRLDGAMTPTPQTLQPG